MFRSNLRGQVLRGPTECLHGGRISDPFFTQAKVGDLDVSVFVQHEVFQLWTRTRCNHHVFFFNSDQAFLLIVVIKPFTFRSR